MHRSRPTFLSEGYKKRGSIWMAYVDVREVRVNLFASRLAFGQLMRIHSERGILKTGIGYDTCMIRVLARRLLRRPSNSVVKGSRQVLPSRPDILVVSQSSHHQLLQGQQLEVQQMLLQQQIKRRSSQSKKSRNRRGRGKPPAPSDKKHRKHDC